MTHPLAEVVAAGPLTTVQDLGRPGMRRLGVAVSGAFDRGALVRANRVLGNPEGAACLEVTLGGLALRFLADGVIAVTGGEAALTVDAGAVEPGVPVAVAAGSLLRLGTCRRGVRVYLAVAGGVAGEPVLGSTSRDGFSGLGPLPLRAGDVVAGAGLARSRPAAQPVEDVAAGRVEVDAVAGPRDDWLTETSLAALFTAGWVVGRDSDRTGVRLTGPVLSTKSEELAPEPVLCGGIQVPTGGQPIVFGPDHPVTGGYPVVAMVTASGVDLLAQTRPGQSVALRRVRARLDLG